MISFTTFGENSALLTCALLLASAKAEIQEEASGALESPKCSDSCSHVTRGVVVFVPVFEIVSINYFSNTKTCIFPNM